MLFLDQLERYTYLRILIKQSFLAQEQHRGILSSVNYLIGLLY